jgi:hypothetical protein
MSLPSGLSELVDDEEPLARYLTSKSSYNTKGIKSGAFNPSPIDGKTSVFRHGDEPLSSLKSIGSKNIPVNKIHGVAIINAKTVRETILEIEASEPPELHANITKWPLSDDPDLQKAERLKIAIILSQKSKKILF